LEYLYEREAELAAARTGGRMETPCSRFGVLAYLELRAGGWGPSATATEGAARILRTTRPDGTVPQ
jgi:hypothetical protein